MAARSTSMKDVAVLAGVSIGTVTTGLNRADQVTDATRNRVQDAIAKLGWVRNESARQLRARRTAPWQRSRPQTIQRAIDTMV